MVQKQTVFLLVLLLVLPINVHAEVSSIEITPAERYVAYPGQTVQHHIDVTYTGNSGTTLKLELGTQYLSLSLIHIPSPRDGLLSRMPSSA